MSLVNFEYLDNAYNKEGKTDRQIGEEQVPPVGHKVIYRMRKKLGIKSRTRGEAQSLALKMGRHKHPTKGTKRSDEVKEKISNKVANSWGNLSEEELKRRSDISKVNWEKMDEEQIKKLRHQAAVAIRKAATEGSKLEKYIYEVLVSEGYRAEFHKKNFLMNEELEIDIVLPDKKICIEIDGPTHFLPVWGEEKLKEHMQRDMVKSGLILGAGYSIIRIKNTSKTVSGFIMRKAIEDVLAAIPKMKNNLFEIEA